MQKLNYLIFLFIISCSPSLGDSKHERSALSNKEEEYDLLAQRFGTLREASAFEAKNNSTDISYDHYVDIGEDLYPNSHRYKLTSVRSFQRKSGDIPYSVDYWLSTDDSIRVELYTWKNETLFRSDSVSSDTSGIVFYNSSKTIEKEFFTLAKKISMRYGSPKNKSIEEIDLSSTDGEEVEWSIPINGHLTLILFKGTEEYREVRLVRYFD